MARVHTAKASKDYPAHGINKGDTYFYWQLFKQPKQMSMTRPRQSQLTGSSKLSAVYAACEQLEDSMATADNPQTLIDDLNQCAEDIRAVAEEYGESADNMEEAFPNGNPTIELCRDNAENLEAFASELEDAATEIEGMSASDFIDHEALRTLVEDHLQEQFDGDGEYEQNDDDVDAEIEVRTQAITDFESLSADEQSEFMDVARDHATGPSCPI